MSDADLSGNGFRSQQRWALAGKFLVAVGTLVTVVLGLLALYDRFASAADLAAKISSVAYVTPPHLNPDGTPAKIEGEDMMSSWELPPEYGGYLVISLENTGGTQAENVTFSSPYRGVGTISSDTIQPRDFVLENSIDIGVIAPSQTITIRLWTQYKPAYYTENEIRIRHSKGVADIIFLRETDGWWRTLGRGLYSIAVVLFYVLCTVIVFYGIPAMLEHRSKKKKLASAPKDTAPDKDS